MTRSGLRVNRNSLAPELRILIPVPRNWRHAMQGCTEMNQGQSRGERKRKSMAESLYWNSNRKKWVKQGKYAQ